jgi:hypothetical protein
MVDTGVKRREKLEHFSLINFPFYIDKKTACNFLSAMKILICYGTAEIYVRLFGTAQMIEFFFQRLSIEQTIISVYV